MSDPQFIRPSRGHMHLQSTAATSRRFSRAKMTHVGQGCPAIHDASSGSRGEVGKAKGCDSIPLELVPGPVRLTLAVHPRRTLR